ncbi:MAG: hypothetical protein HQL07_19530 [Nitrospirae bacterium]|nr:hypothetical protein [Magnetococcales bacterium]
MALCEVFFAEGAKNTSLRRAPAHFSLEKKKRGKNASGDGACEKQSQKQNKNKKQSKNPGGNPPDPFFLLIVLFCGTPGEKNACG